MEANDSNVIGIMEKLRSQRVLNLNSLRKTLDKEILSERVNDYPHHLWLPKMKTRRRTLSPVLPDVRGCLE
jgi:hypothetical protein